MRVAHLTDLHVRHDIPGVADRPRVRSHEMAEILPAALSDARRRGAELIAVSGDLVDVPAYLLHPDRDPAADRTLWRAARADYRWLIDTLDASRLPWIAVPGSTDSHRLLRAELGDRPRVVDRAGLRFFSYWDREPSPGLPQRIGTERCRLDAALTDPDPTPQVHLQHYPIEPATAWQSYLEAAELAERLRARDQLTLVLSGHDHRGADPVRHGLTLFSATPSLAEAPHAYRLFDITPDIAPDGVPAGAIEWEQVELASAPLRSPVVFLDRDGCINTLPAYRSGPEAMELLTGAAPGIRRLRAAGYRIVVVTNQACVGLGYATPSVLAEVHDRMSALLAVEGAAVDAVYASYEAGSHAIHDQFRTTELSKPSPAMLLRAADDLHLDLAASFMIGDRAGDLAAGRAAGATPILVRTGHGRHLEQERTARGESVGCPVVDDLAQAAELIVSQLRVAPQHRPAVGSLR